MVYAIGVVLVVHGVIHAIGFSTDWVTGLINGRIWAVGHALSTLFPGSYASATFDPQLSWWLPMIVLRDPAVRWGLHRRDPRHPHHHRQAAATPHKPPSRTDDPNGLPRRPTRTSWS